MAPPRRNIPLLNDPAELAAAYESSTIADLAGRLDVSATTVQRSLDRHGIERRPRNRNRRPTSARRLDDADWLAEQYRTRTGVEIADELGVTARTVYAAMDRHGISRRAEPGALKLTRPQLADADWLAEAVERGSSATIAAELEVSPGTVTNAYGRAGIEPTTTPELYARGRRRERPSADELQAAWEAERSFRGVARRVGTSHTTAAVWLAEVGIFADSTPALSRPELLDAIKRGRAIAQIASEHGVAKVTVKVELHRQGLFEAHRQRHRLEHWHRVGPSA